MPRARGSFAAERKTPVNHLSLLPLAGALILTASVAWSANEPAAPISVVMKSISYDPKRVEVPVGGSVVWTNKAFTNHTATSDDAQTFDTGEIKPNESSSPVKFDKEGEFTYHCKIHGKTMSGLVVVKPTAAN